MQAARLDLQSMQMRAAMDAEAAAVNAQALQAQLQDLHADAASVPALQDELQLLRQQLRRAERQLQEQTADHRWGWLWWEWANALDMGGACPTWHGGMHWFVCFTVVLWPMRIDRAPSPLAVLKG